LGHMLLPSLSRHLRIGKEEEEEWCGEGYGGRRTRRIVGPGHAECVCKGVCVAVLGECGEGEEKEEASLSPRCLPQQTAADACVCGGVGGPMQAPLPRETPRREKEGKRGGQRKRRTPAHLTASLEECGGEGGREEERDARERCQGPRMSACSRSLAPSLQHACNTPSCNTAIWRRAERPSLALTKACGGVELN
jgi:hypothetical protein